MIQIAHVKTYPKKLPNSEPVPRTFYIGRAMPGYEESLLSNPFKIGVHGNRDEVIAMYDQLFTLMLSVRPHLIWPLLKEIADAADQEGCVLLCWCHPEPCHGEVIKRWINAILQYRKVKHEANRDSTVLRREVHAR
jgi:hypothetical protein